MEAKVIKLEKSEYDTQSGFLDSVRWNTEHLVNDGYKIENLEVFTGTISFAFIVALPRE